MTTPENGAYVARCDWCGSTESIREVRDGVRACPVHADPHTRAAVTVGRALLEQRDEARKALAEVLHLFTEKGHPGRPCRRTGWVYEETVARWRAVLDDTGPTPNAPSEATP